MFDFIKSFFSKKCTPSKEIMFSKVDESESLSGFGLSFYPTGNGQFLGVPSSTPVPIVDVQDLINKATDPSAVLDIIQSHKNREHFDLKPGFSGVVSNWNYTKGSGSF